MVNAEEIKKARKILGKEMKPYLDLDFSEIQVARYMNKKFNHHWQSLLAFNKGEIKSLKVAMNITKKILNKVKPNE